MSILFLIGIIVLVEIEVKKTNYKNHTIFLQIKKLVKDFLDKSGFKEIDCPLLSPTLIPESYLEIFETENLFTDKKEKMYLTPSPELFLKRLISADIGNCYFLGKSFRNNEPVEKKHNFEFTMLEFYRVNGTYFDLMDDVMDLLRFLAKNILNKDYIVYHDKKIDLERMEKITVAEAFKKYTGISNIFDHKIFFEEAKNKGYRVADMSYVDLWSLIYGLEIESKLGTSGLVTFIYDYPPELAAITRINKDGISERFEFYIDGVELGNCGNEGVNLKEYKKRFNNDIKIRKENGLINYLPDKSFISVLEQMPKCSGIAIGVDRLAMIFAGVDSISDLQMFTIK